MLRRSLFAALSTIAPAFAMTAASVVPRAAYADEHREARAQALFEEGRTLLSAGRTQEACAKLEESDRLDPGGGTRLNLGLCYEQLGRIAMAYASFEDALARAVRDRRPDREALARTHLEALDRRVPTIVLPPETRDVIVDGAPLRVTDGGRLRVEPGLHVVAVQPGGPRWTVSIGEGEVRTLRGEDGEASRPRPHAQAASGASAPSAATEATPSTAFVQEHSPWPLVAFGVALVGYGFATWGGLRLAFHGDDDAAKWAVGLGSVAAVGGTVGALALPYATMRPRARVSATGLFVTF